MKVPPASITLEKGQVLNFDLIDPILNQFFEFVLHLYCFVQNFLCLNYFTKEIVLDLLGLALTFQELNFISQAFKPILKLFLVLFVTIFHLLVFIALDDLQ